jgi:hypothetical protein
MASSITQQWETSPHKKVNVMLYDAGQISHTFRLVLNGGKLNLRDVRRDIFLPSHLVKKSVIKKLHRCSEILNGTRDVLKPAKIKANIQKKFLAPTDSYRQTAQALPTSRNAFFAIHRLPYLLFLQSFT